MAKDDTLNARRHSLRRSLEARRSAIAAELQARLRRIRETGAEPWPADDLEDRDPSALDAQLVEVAAATLRRVDDALRHLEQGRYGRCTRCHRLIAEARLQALPFAVRCHRCELLREQASSRGRNGVRSSDLGAIVRDTAEPDAA
jgi:DnaK suppressor protein